MKIYTEINYEFKDGELIEIDSKFFNYTGELLLCTGGGGTTTADVVPNIPGLPDPMEDVGQATADMAQANADAANGEDEDDEDAEDEANAFSKGTASLQGQNPILQINKTTGGPTGKFSRGSLQVQRPS